MWHFKGPDWGRSEPSKEIRTYKVHNKIGRGRATNGGEPKNGKLCLFWARRKERRKWEPFDISSSQAGRQAGSLPFLSSFLPSFPLSSLNIDFVTTAFCLSSRKETGKGRGSEDERTGHLFRLFASCHVDREGGQIGTLKFHLGSDGGGRKTKTYSRCSWWRFWYLSTNRLLDGDLYYRLAERVGDKNAVHFEEKAVIKLHYLV